MTGVQTEPRIQRLAQAAQVADLMADRAQQLELELARLQRELERLEAGDGRRPGEQSRLEQLRTNLGASVVAYLELRS